MFSVCLQVRFTLGIPTLGESGIVRSAAVVKRRSINNGRGNRKVV